MEDYEPNSSSRYEVEGIELSSGYLVEFWIPQDEFDHNEGLYIPSRIEHAEGDYYIFALGSDVPIEGRRVRICK